MPPVDDWEKPRSNGHKLTAAEVARVRVAFNCGRDHRDIARELQCSSRTIARYYGGYRDELKWRKAVEAAKPKPVEAPKPLFYKSNFDLEET
jgi:DNA-binding NarL/FixJ family response regulator